MTNRTAIHPEFERSIQRRNHNTEPPVVIEVRKRRSTMQPGYAEARAGLGRDIRKLALLVAQNSIRLCLVRIQAAAGDKQVEPTVIVQIYQAAAPTAPALAESNNPAGSASVIEAAVAAIYKELKGFSAQASHNDVRESVSIDIGKVRTHAGDLSPISIEGYAGLDADFLQLAQAIPDKQIARIVICDEKARTAVSSEVGYCDAHSLAEKLAEPHLPRDFREGPV